MRSGSGARSIVENNEMSSNKKGMLVGVRSSTAMMRIAGQSARPAALAAIAVALSATTALAGAVGTPSQRRLVFGTGQGGPSRVDVLPNGGVLQSFLPFGPSFQGGVSVAQGDVTGDGVEDIIVGAGPGGGPVVKVFDGVTNAERDSFFAYVGSFSGGINVAAGDVNGDGVADVVVGIPGIDGVQSPIVRAFAGPGMIQIADFFGIEDPAFRGGVRVAVGDVNGDGIGDIAAGLERDGQFLVRTFAGPGMSEIVDFFGIEDLDFRGGASIAVGDIDGDGFGDIGIGAPGGQFGFGVRVFAPTGTILVELGMPSLDGAGKRVAIGDLNGDGNAEIGVATGPGADGQVLLFDAQGNQLPPPTLPPEPLGRFLAVPCFNPPCLGDANNDALVNFTDITSVLTNFNATGGVFRRGDSDGNGVVGFSDITATLTNFGGSCP